MRIVDDLRVIPAFSSISVKPRRRSWCVRAVGAVAQIDNVTVAELQQMLCCQTAACQIINADRVDLIAADERRRSGAERWANGGTNFWIMVPASCCELARMMPST